MAQKFIDQITDYIEYNINIMDESGVLPGINMAIIVNGKKEGVVGGLFC